jgi:hypothetical protein
VATSIRVVNGFYAALFVIAGAGLFAANAVIVWTAGVSILPFAVTLAAHALAGRRSA